jgi:hypothetical protein
MHAKGEQARTTFEAIQSVAGVRLVGSTGNEREQTSLAKVRVGTIADAVD